VEAALDTFFFHQFRLNALPPKRPKRPACTLTPSFCFLHPPPPSPLSWHLRYPSPSGLPLFDPPTVLLPVPLNSPSPHSLPPKNSLMHTLASVKGNSPTTFFLQPTAATPSVGLPPSPCSFFSVPIYGTSVSSLSPIFPSLPQRPGSTLTLFCIPTRTVWFVLYPPFAGPLRGNRPGLTFQGLLQLTYLPPHTLHVFSLSHNLFPPPGSNPHL